MEFRLLGPLQVVDGERTISVPAGKQRALLLLLLLHRNRAVATDRLVEELWNGSGPPTAAKIVRNYVSLLRKELGVELAAEAGGYALRVPAGAVDIDRFEQLAADADRALRDGDATLAADAFRSALDLWRGPALADAAYEAFAQTEAGRLEELRLTCVEGRIEAELQLGGHAALVPELEALVREHPLREELRAQLMLALYRSGRQAEALAAFQDARRTLTDELGLEPGPRLRTLERQMLEHDPSLEAPRPSRAPWQRRSRTLDSFLAAVLLAAAVLVVVAIVRGVRETEQAAVVLGPNSVGAIDPESGTIVAQVPLGARASRLAGAGNQVWALSSDERTLYRIDAADQRLTGSARFEGVVSDVAANEAGAVVLHAGPSNAAQLTRFSADQPTPLRLATWATGETLSGSGGSSFGTLLDRVAVDPRRFVVSHVGEKDSAIVAGPVNGEDVETRRAISGGVYAIALAADGVWAAGEHLLRRLDRDDLVTVAEISLSAPEIADAVTVGEGAVWVASVPSYHCCPSVREGTPLVTRVDQQAGATDTTIPLSGFPEAVVAGLGSVWVTEPSENAVLRIDPQSNRVVDTIRLGVRPTGIAIARGLVWVSVSN